MIRSVPATLGKSLAMAALAALLSACAVTPANRSAEDQVRESAEQRWQALIKRDFSTAYRFLPPSARGVISQEQYVRRFGSAAAWQAATVDSVVCEAQRCTARVRISARPVLGMRFGDMIETYADETWVLEESKWWFFERP